MSNSYKKNPCYGVECRGLGSYSKSYWHRRWRHFNKIRLNCQVDLEDYYNVPMHDKSPYGYEYIKDFKRFYSESKGSLKKDLRYFSKLPENKFSFIPWVEGDKYSIHKFWGK